MKRLIILGTTVVVSVGLYFVGCSVDNPVDTESRSGKTEPAPLFSSTEFNTVLVPDGDVPEWGWIPIPAPPWTRYDKIDEGTDSLDNEIIYTEAPNVWDRFTFSNISGYDDIDASEIVFTIPMHLGVTFPIVPMIGLES